MDRISVADRAANRNERAVFLLREALALLGAETLQSASAAPRGPDRLLRLPEVQRLTGLGRSAIYQQMQRGAFPRSVKVGPRAATWSEAAVQAWIFERLRGSAST